MALPIESNFSDACEPLECGKLASSLVMVTSVVLKLEKGLVKGFSMMLVSEGAP